MQERIIQIIHQSIESKMQAGELLTPFIVDASELLVSALLNERKILVAGNGNCAALGDIFVGNLLNRFQHERPALPAINLMGDSAVVSAIASDSSYNDVFAKQVRAIGQPGDVLLLVSNNGNASNLIQAVAAAHDREMAVIALTAEEGGDIATLLDVNDIELRAPAEAIFQILEIHLLCLLCLCDLIDYQLFGTSHE
ncbi:SIS domain-containing protein [Aurantivibrio plasticivorans]